MLYEVITEIHAREARRASIAGVLVECAFDHGDEAVASLVGWRAVDAEQFLDGMQGFLKHFSLSLIIAAYSETSQLTERVAEMEVLILVLIGLGAGMSSGLFGIGGGVLIVLV